MTSTKKKKNLNKSWEFLFCEIRLKLEMKKKLTNIYKLNNNINVKSMDFNRLLYFFEHFKMCVCFVSCFDYCISFGFIRILNHIVCSYINCKKKLQIKWIESKHNHKIAFEFNKTSVHWTNGDWKRWWVWTKIGS